MISFTVLSEDNGEILVNELLKMLPKADPQQVGEVIGSLLALDEGEEYALSASSGCLLFRVFDGEYFFLYPEEAEEGADPVGAIADIREYAVKEEIALTICEVPKFALGEVVGAFRHVSVDAENGAGDVFTVKVQSEAALLSQLPSVESDNLVFGEITTSDAREYAGLCRDDDTNKYWGYSLFDDIPDATDEQLAENAAAEFDFGFAIPFAVRLEGKLIGEALLYRFDLIGGCECGIRLLPQYRGRGFGNECLEMLKTVAEEIGIIRIFATVINENAPSIALFKKDFEVLENDGEITRFVYNL